MSIVVVGASNNVHKPGGAILKNLISGGYTGELRAVNPKEQEVQGIRAYADVKDIPDTDLAILAIPAPLCPDAVETLAAEKHVRAFIILSAGFGEETHEGALLEDRILETVNRYGASLIGPNCIGYMNAWHHSVFSQPIPQLHPQGVDLISSSGATAVFILESAVTKGLPFCSVWSVGNAKQIGVEDVLQYMDENFDPDRDSHIKLLYIESIGDPDRLLFHASSLIKKGCRIAAIKSGSSESGSRAASSHTGAIASSDSAVEALFRKAGNNRIIVATFSSNIHRVQQIMNVAASLGRKVALVGRSLENVVSISAELGYLNIPEGIVIDINMINRYPADKLVIITTGSQGEPMSALTRMAFSDHRKVEIHPNDYVIISATPIPGNEKTVSRVVNELMKLGADVVYEKMYEVHVSGHACQEELKMIMGIVKPKYFIPVHGELKHLRKHAGLALSMGIPKENILIADNGRVAEISKKALRCTSTVPAGRVFVDGYGVGDVGSVVLRDRKHLAQDGLVIVAVCIDRESGMIVSGPDVVTRGFVYVKESEELINAAREVAVEAIEAQTDGGYFDWNSIKASLRDEISHLMYERTKRSPMILPVIMEV